QARPLPQNECQRPGPEAFSQPLGRLRPIPTNHVSHFDATDMNDQGTRGRAALGFKDTPDGCGVECIGSQAVYGLSWKRDQLSFANEPRRRNDRRLAQSGRSSLPSAAVFPVFFQTRKACMNGSRSPSSARSTSPTENLVRWSLIRRYGAST